MIKNIEKNENLIKNEDLAVMYQKMERLIEELNKKEIPANISQVINQKIDSVNSIVADSDHKINALKKIHSDILILVRKELDLVSKGFYKNSWTIKGLLYFGVPLALAFYIIFENPGLFAIGMAMGLPIGIAIGNNKDRTAKKNNRQLNL